MNDIQKILNNKDFIVTELEEWTETFNPENIFYNKLKIDEDDEIEMNKSYENMLGLVERLKNNQCSNKDFEDVVFHIEQINYNEIRIQL